MKADVLKEANDDQAGDEVFVDFAEELKNVPTDSINLLAIEIWVVGRMQMIRIDAC